MAHLNEKNIKIPNKLVCRDDSINIVPTKLFLCLKLIFYYIIGTLHTDINKYIIFV